MALAHPKQTQCVLFFVPTLEAGGAERVCLHYVNHLTAFRPILLLQYRRGPLLKELAEDIPILEIFQTDSLVPAPKLLKFDRCRRLMGRIRRAVSAFLITAHRLLRNFWWTAWKLRGRLGIRLNSWPSLRHISEHVASCLESCLHKARSFLRRIKAWFAHRLLVIAGFTASIPSRVNCAVLNGLRKVEPLWYCYSLLWQARRLAVLARRSGSAAVVSLITIPNIIAILAKLFFYRRLKVVINVHDITSRILEHSKLKPYERFLLRWLIHLLYPRADLVVAVAQGIKRDLVESFKIPPERIIVIHNPIDLETVRRRAAEPVDHPWFDGRSGPLVMAVGRLVKLKAFDLLIEAFAKLPADLSARLVILGDGEERPRLQQLIEQLGLADRVALLGFQENPWKYMGRADAFVLSSLTEGLPNVIGEALALGLPVVATDCSPGIREYLQDGQAGLLVPPGDVGALARRLEHLLTDSTLRKQLAQRASECVEAFNLARAIRTYEITLTFVIGCQLD